MTRKDFQETMKALEATRKKGLSSKAAAIKVLKDAGILNKNGDLKKKYRQPQQAA